MGNLIVTDADFSFEWNSTENSTPPGSADIADQSVLQNIQHWSEDFFFVLTLTENSTPPGSADIAEQDVLWSLQHWSEDFFYALVLITEKCFYIHIQTKAKKPLGTAEITITDLDNPANPPLTGTTNAWGNITLQATIMSRYNVAVKKSGYRPYSFELGMITSQPAVKGIRTLFPDFKSIIVAKEETEAVEESG